MRTRQSFSSLHCRVASILALLPSSMSLQTAPGISSESASSLNESMPLFERLFALLSTNGVARTLQAMRAYVVDAATLAKSIKPFSDTMASTLQGVQSAFLSHVPYFGKALPMIVAGIFDESDIVCDVAMHAGLIAANARALSIAKDLLASLEAANFDAWRMCHSSISLLGGLVMFSGVCLCLAEVIPSLPKKKLNPGSGLKVSHFAHVSGKDLEAFLRTSTLE
ncbi:hypothetical protein SPRG_16212 [Saprolegnia parasitica CBS 223.65]|uniref:Uncharacterized protein n=1 Tax=Saprolegnia parasitica (strain CBS 223.65) TaxID=695850 RepID=A0A067BNQ3_SAPPC|nr:hypothetical protein SPRG_16212 [Saprolegnia parasitica CBS 223.65]KDO18380.1 hypothetical protein SPRG_16212 [Saprolegnia parasitica CBS 223.65]|eukprot:XP_012210910.1 hypothetical protein SPRG_16212 [Saprolegnia parasitica CBS 223.65]